MKDQLKQYPTTISPTFVVIAGLFVCFLMMANIIVNRLVTFGGLVFNGDLFLFPLTYIFGDILTEVYGFKRSRLVIWVGFAANIIMALYFSVVLRLPYPTEFTDNNAFMTVLGATPLIVTASLIAYFFGEYTNSATMSILKKKTEGKWLWMRTIGSTLVGQLVDTVLFMTIALHYLPPVVLLQIIAVNYSVKVAYEVFATPFTYVAINKLKKAEGVDTYDYGVKYNPFGLDVEKDTKKASK
ncbi:MAG TPA: queuosine precursor transporter [Candidatus Woesebacteria bacterium]|nr:queuosine precursor transporter [Candidatus Woesebacteria bacterium]